MFSLIYAWTNVWANNRDAGDLRRNGAHYAVIVMECELAGALQILINKYYTYIVAQ